MTFFFLDYNFSALDIVEPWSKETWSILYVTCVNIIAQVSLTPIFLFLDVPTLKLRIIIIILPTDRPEIILPTARTTKD